MRTGRRDCGVPDGHEDLAKETGPHRVADGDLPLFGGPIMPFHSTGHHEVDDERDAKCPPRDLATTPGDGQGTQGQDDKEYETMHRNSPGKAHRAGSGHRVAEKKAPETDTRFY